MKKIKIKAEYGVFLEGKEEFRKLFNELKGEYIVSFLPLSDPHTVEDWRRLYFHLRDLIWEHSDTGYTKDQFHAELKKKCLLPMFEALEYFTVPNSPPTLSTKFLSEAGWREFVGRVKEFAQNELEVFI